MLVAIMFTRRGLVGAWRAVIVDTVATTEVFVSLS